MTKRRWCVYSLSKWSINGIIWFRDKAADGLLIRWVPVDNPTCCWWKKSSSPVEVGSLSHYLQGFIHVPGGDFSPDFWSIKKYRTTAPLLEQTRSISLHVYHTRWFNQSVTEIDSLVGGHLLFSKRSLNHTEKVTKNCQVYHPFMLICVFFQIGMTRLFKDFVSDAFPKIWPTTRWQTAGHSRRAKLGGMVYPGLLQAHAGKEGSVGFRWSGLRKACGGPGDLRYTYF